MSGIKKVKEIKAENKEVVVEETTGFFTKVGQKCDNGVKFVKKHWKPIVGIGAAGAAAAAGLAAFKGFNDNDNLDLLDNSLNEEDPMA